jgi:hypothetical protein
MSLDADRSALQLVSLVKASGELELSLAAFSVPKPGPDEVLLTTTFASSYTARVSLAEALQLSAVRDYAKQATGTKYVITPHAES